MRLYEIHHALASLFSQLDDADDTTRPEIELKIREMEVAHDEKLASCCAHFKNLESEIEAIEKEISRLSKKREDLLARIDKFKKYFSAFAPQASWTNGIHKLSWRQGTSLDIFDAEKIPAAYKKEIWELVPHNKEIKLALQMGAEVPGAKLITEKHLQVK